MRATRKGEGSGTERAGVDDMAASLNTTGANKTLVATARASNNVIPHKHSLKADGTAQVRKPQDCNVHLSLAPPHRVALGHALVTHRSRNRHARDKSMHTRKGHLTTRATDRTGDGRRAANITWTTASPPHPQRRDRIA